MALSCILPLYLNDNLARYFVLKFYIFKKFWNVQTSHTPFCILIFLNRNTKALYQMSRPRKRQDRFRSARHLLEVTFMREKDKREIRNMQGKFSDKDTGLTPMKREREEGRASNWCMVLRTFQPSNEEPWFQDCPLMSPGLVGKWLQANVPTMISSSHFHTRRYVISDQMPWQISKTVLTVGSQPLHAERPTGTFLPEDTPPRLLGHYLFPFLDAWTFMLHPWNQPWNQIILYYSFIFFWTTLCLNSSHPFASLFKEFFCAIIFSLSLPSEDTGTDLWELS